MKKKEGLIVLLTMIILLLGCVKTPNKEITINKSDCTLENMIMCSPEPFYAYQHPAFLHETMRIHNIDCIFDAEVTIPSNAGFPVWKAQSVAFEDRFITNFVNHYITDPAYVRKNGKTLKDIEDELLAAMRGEVFVDDQGNLYYEPFEEQEELVDSLKSEYLSWEDVRFSPEEIDYSIRPFEFTYVTKKAENWVLCVTSDSFYACAFGPNDYLQMNTWVSRGNAYPGEPVGSDIGDLPLEEADAIKIAYQMLTDLNISNLGFVSSEKARFLNCYSYNTLSTGWYLVFCRNDNGAIPEDLYSYSQASPLLFEQESFSEPWLPEILRVYVDTDGIKYIKWDHHYETTECLNKNVTILPFEEIKELIQNYISIGTSWSYKELPSLHVKRINLTYACIKARNISDYKLLAPVWIVEYTIDNKEGRSMLLAINAIDGSRAELGSFQVPLSNS